MVNVAIAAYSPPAAAATFPSGEDTSHLDQVQAALKQVSPGLEGKTWERTEGNRLGPDSDDWLLQVPGCWGKGACGDKPGVKRLLDKMTSNISQATRSVDVSTLLGDGVVENVWPDKEFKDALVKGLKRAVVARAHTPGLPKIKLRILGGAFPVVSSVNKRPNVYLRELQRDLGEAAKSIDFSVAEMNTYRNNGRPVSWNHSKLVVVDRAFAISGGINSWPGDYVTPANPVTDADISLTGPAAAAAGRYLDTLWGWSCRNNGSTWDPSAHAWVASSQGASCMSTLPAPDHARLPGAVSVISVGDLGLGMVNGDPASKYRLPPARNIGDGKGWVGVDHTNDDRDYATSNPGQAAQLALVASAKKHIELSQQDLIGQCALGMPRYDVRLFDTVASQMIKGVKVRIVVSAPKS